MCRAPRRRSIFSTFLPEYGPQWLGEVSTSESEKAKEVVKTPLFVTTVHLHRCMSPASGTGSMRKRMQVEVLVKGGDENRRLDSPKCRKILRIVSGIGVKRGERG